MRKRRSRVAALVAGAVLGWASLAAAAALTVVSPEVDRDKGEVSALVGAARADGTPARVSDVRLLLDDADAGPAIDEESMADYAAEHNRWSPPLAIGVVYLWAKPGPGTVMDALEALFKHVPGRVGVYPTPYGQGYRPVITRVTAARAAGGDLNDVPVLQGDQYKVVEAVRFNAAKLEQDDSPLKHLVIITDGRDFVEHDERTFAALGDELRKKKFHVEIVWLRPQVDSIQAAANMRALAEAARARLLTADTENDLPSVTESLADSVAGLRRYRFALGWSARAFGGTRRIGASATVDGAPVSGQDGTITLPTSAGAIAGLVLGILVVLGGAGVGVWVWRSRAGGGAVGELLEELQQIIRIGTPAEDAVTDLSQRFPDVLDKLKELDPQKLDPRKYRFLRTRAGQARIKEIQKRLEDTDADPAVDDQVADILAREMNRGAAPQDVARQIRAKVSDDKWSALSRADSSKIKSSLARQDNAALRASKAVDFASEVQAALRAKEGPPLAVGWLVRASGPGKRGQTLRVAPKSCLVGRSADCQLQINDDPQLADQHASVREGDAEFFIRPVGGRVSLEDQELTGEQPLTDGAVVTLGSCRYVFKCVLGR
jgi:hypothetical protein